MNFFCGHCYESGLGPDKVQRSKGSRRNRCNEVCNQSVARSTGHVRARGCPSEPSELASTLVEWAVPAGGNWLQVPFFLPGNGELLGEGGGNARKWVGGV